MQRNNIATRDNSNDFKFKIGSVEPNISLIGVFYGTHMLSTLGHELGHGVIPFMYGEKVNIKVNLLTSGSIAYTTQHIPAKLEPTISALGPIAGIVTCLGVLKMSNIFFEAHQKKSNSVLDSTLMERIKIGIQKPLINKDQSPALILGTLYACNAEAAQFYNFHWLYKSLNYIGFKCRIPTSDGQRITEHFSLSKTKAFVLRNAIATTAFSFVWHTFGLFQCNKHDEKGKSNENNFESTHLSSTKSCKR